MKKHGYYWEINGDMLKTDTFTISMSSISSITLSHAWWGIISAFIAFISIGIFIYSLFLKTTRADALLIFLVMGFLLSLSSQLIIISDGKKYKVSKRFSLDGWDDIEYLKDAIEQYLKEK